MPSRNEERADAARALREAVDHARGQLVELSAQLKQAEEGARRALAAERHGQEIHLPAWPWGVADAAEEGAAARELDGVADRGAQALRAALSTLEGWRRNRV